VDNLLEKDDLGLERDLGVLFPLAAGFLGLILIEIGL